MVQNAINKNLPFELEELLRIIQDKLKAQSNDVKLMLIKWIETLHSLTNVDISRCVPMFLNIFLDLLNKEIKHPVTDAVSS